MTAAPGPSQSSLSMRLLLVLSVATGACSFKEELIVFHAASLSRSFDEAARQFAAEQPRFRVRLEASGSQVAARKVSELGRRADLVALADSGLLDEMLLPAHATWAADLLSNEMVIAHRDHSRHTDIISSDNWPQILLRQDVTLGCVDPNLAPIGYRTLLVWKLVEARGLAGIAERLQSRCAPEHVMPHEAELVALLFARSIDYAFVYRSTAEEHHLKITTLPDAINLGATNVDYSGVEISVLMKSADPPRIIRGAPILFGMTIPNSAPDPEGAARFAAFLAGPTTRSIFERSGFRPLDPIRIRGPGPVPTALSQLARPGATP